MKVYRFFNRDGTPFVRPGDTEPLEIGSSFTTIATLIIPYHNGAAIVPLQFNLVYEDVGEVGYVLNRRMEPWPAL